MSVLNRKLVRDLWHLRGQVVSVALVVACGIATYISMRSAHDSLVLSQQSYYASYRFADVFAQLKRAPEPLAAKIAAIPGVAAVQTRVVAEVTLDVPGLDAPATGRIVSIPERPGAILNDLYLRRGRRIEPGRRDEVLVSDAFATANGLRLGDTLGAVIQGRWERLRIVGVALSPEYVYEIRGGEILPDNRRFGVLWMGREAIGRCFDMDGAFNDVSLKLAPGAGAAGVIDRLDALLARYGGLGAYGRDDQISHRFVTDEIAETEVTSTIIPAIFLGIAAFLVNIVLSRLVATQRSQIAVLKAFGYGNPEVGRHYLAFGLVAVLAGTLLGSFAGAWLGSALAVVYSRFFQFPLLRLDASPRLLLFAIAISALSAGLGALSAVRRAVALPPAEAMRPEAPARFRAGFLERSGLYRLLSASTRMILRNLTRRPGKAALSTLALALAIAIMVISYSFNDAIDFMIRLQFQTIQREDVSVVLNEVRSSVAVHALASLPGVRRVETFRAVAVRLRSGHRWRSVGIVGVRPGDELRNLVDRRFKRLPVPPEGLVLSQKLAEILGVRPGGEVTVEVLEGSRPVRRVPVAAAVDDLVGLSVTMDAAALHRLLREGDSVSGAFLAVDPSEIPRLYALLKHLPAIGGIAVREEMLKSFQATVAESMVISMTMLIGFACVIAFAIVYNGTRIALSERGNELASLRVLGFTHREIAAILLGEQGVLTLLATPFGFAIGYAMLLLVTLGRRAELFRFPVIVSLQTYAIAFVTVAVAAFLSGLVVYGRLRRLDLVAVLKSRE
jgi:putative ABC transport system permease protein